MLRCEVRVKTQVYVSGILDEGDAIGEWPLESLPKSNSRRRDESPNSKPLYHSLIKGRYSVY